MSETLEPNNAIVRYTKSLIPSPTVASIAVRVNTNQSGSFY